MHRWRGDLRQNRVEFAAISPIQFASFMRAAGRRRGDTHRMINVAAIRMQQFGVQFYQASLTAGDIDKLVRFEVLNYGERTQPVVLPRHPPDAAAALRDRGTGGPVLPPEGAQGAGDEPEVGPAPRGGAGGGGGDRPGAAAGTPGHGRSAGPQDRQGLLHLEGR